MNVSFLDKIISNEDIADDNQPALNPVAEMEASSRITSPGQIIRLLKKVYNSHQLLTVELEHNDTQHSSMILEINEAGGYMVLDEFYPKLTSQVIAVSSKLEFYTFVSGVEINFISTIEAIAGIEEEPYYKIPIPEKILYFQKRQFLRVPVSVANPIKIVLSDNKDMICNGEIRDLSIGGFSARLKLTEQRYTVGDLVPKCMLYMPEDRKILCSVEVRQIELPGPTAPPKIGARFLDLRNQDQKTIERFVAKIDRDLVRRFRN